MIENLPPILKAFTSAKSTLKVFTDWRTKTKGEIRALVGEIKQNYRYCEIVLDNDVSLDTVIDKFNTAEYDRLSNAGFDFNALKRGKIGKFKSLGGTDLESWQGKTTEQLLNNIYDKILDLKTKYPFLSKRENFLWRRRLINIRKRILILLMHVNN